MDASGVSERVLDILCSVVGNDRPRSDPDVPLYDAGLVDSLGTVDLMAAFEESFGLLLSPAEFDRAAWSTPRRLVTDIQRRLAELGQPQGRPDR